MPAPTSGGRNGIPVPWLWEEPQLRQSQGLRLHTANMRIRTVHAQTTQCNYQSHVGVDGRAERRSFYGKYVTVHEGRQVAHNPNSSGYMDGQWLNCMNEWMNGQLASFKAFQIKPLVGVSPAGTWLLQFYESMTSYVLQIKIFAMGNTRCILSRPTSMNLGQWSNPLIYCLFILCWGSWREIQTYMSMVSESNYLDYNMEST